MTPNCLHSEPCIDPLLLCGLLSRVVATVGGWYSLARSVIPLTLTFEEEEDAST